MAPMSPKTLTEISSSNNSGYSKLAKSTPAVVPKKDTVCTCLSFQVVHGSAEATRTPHSNKNSFNKL